MRTKLFSYLPYLPFKPLYNFRPFITCTYVDDVGVDSVFALTNANHKGWFVICVSCECLQTFAYGFGGCINHLRYLFLSLINYVLVVHMIQDIEYNLCLFIAGLENIGLKVRYPYFVIAKISDLKLVVRVLNDFTRCCINSIQCFVRLMSFVVFFIIYILSLINCQREKYFTEIGTKFPVAKCH